MKKGFTLIELMIVVALILMFSTLTLPVGFGFFREATLKDQARNLENSLRRAQAMAITNQGGSNVGVAITSSECTIFEGNSYESRQVASQIIVPFSVSVSVSGADEVIFQQSTGLLSSPSEEASTTLTLGDNSQTITINAQGKIERYGQAE